MAAGVAEQRKGEVQKLFAEFLSDYPTTEDGQRHLEAYPSGREEAQQNFAAIVAAHKRNEDITNLVLRKLLPHATMTAMILVLFATIAFAQGVPMERKESEQHSMDNALGGSSTSSHDARNYKYKPRIINTTDLGADPDDEQSMVRQLVGANEFDLDGLIVSTSCWKNSQSNTDMLD